MKLEEKPKIDLNLNVGFYIASHNVLSVFKRNQKMDANHFIWTYLSKINLK